MEKGQNVLWDIDPQGARAVVEKEKECVSVFILPPSYKVLKQRLHTRNTEDPTEIARRLGNAKGEIDQLQRYQYAVVNDSLELAFEQLAGDLSRLSEEAQILQKNISTTITDTALTLDCSVLCIENIAEQVEFDVLEKP
jgi:guanylate kinase